MHIYSEPRSTQFLLTNAAPGAARSTLKIRTRRPNPITDTRYSPVDDDTMWSTMVEFGFTEQAPS